MEARFRFNRRPRSGGATRVEVRSKRAAGPPRGVTRTACRDGLLIRRGAAESHLNAPCLAPERTRMFTVDSRLSTGYSPNPAIS